MSIPTPQDPDAAPDRFDEIGLLEFDETVPPRPEEEVADAARSVPDRAGHGGTPDPAEAGEAAERGTAGPTAS
ncbi:MAG: hypothetical protein HHJ14_00575 [Cellulomonas sp.]|uniref:hypothetical protein n=1 Tax=Cellulomonas sp. TaxID=40001 RepID=UPI0017B81E4E|nr:hypothetical protein [Cellulomonas sp.]NMM15661.1 hypothetical protein [Cellulomonas sp.]NMM32076.1 hypothetical protein [Cellulomonas sp.]